MRGMALQWGGAQHEVAVEVGGGEELDLAHEARHNVGQDQPTDHLRIDSW